MFRLHFLLFLLFPLLAFSQDDTYSTTPISRTAIERYFVNDYQAGTLTFIDGSQKEGLIKFNGTVLFKTNNNAKREKYDASIVKWFVVEQDTFLTVQNIEFSYHNLINSDIADFAVVRQIESGKSASLYRFDVKASGGSPGNFYWAKNYYIRKSNSSQYILIPYKNKKFIEAIEPLLLDNQDLIAKIKAEKLGHDDLPQIIKYYNEGKVK